jgi:hypothetical protein
MDAEETTGNGLILVVWLSGMASGLLCILVDEETELTAGLL